MIRVLSLGAGVQSTTVLLMSCRGELPLLDCAVFADTGWEPQPVYEHLVWLEAEARHYDVPVHRVSAGNIRDDAGKWGVGGGDRWASLPLFVLEVNGHRGMLRRQCTSEYKILPIEKFLRREILGLKPRQRAPKEPKIEHWLGISWDEIQRMRMSRHPWAVNHFPLIELRMTRQDCFAWLQRNYPDREVPRSACVGCPYRSNAEWRWLKKRSAADWNDAVDFDKTMRKAGGMRGMRGDLFIHRDRVPLDQVDLRTQKDAGQEHLFACDGMCAT